MKTFERILIAPVTTILEVLRVIDETPIGIALVVDVGRHLLGTITDGDIRRAILRSVPLTAPAESIMNQQPVSVGLETPEDEILYLMSRRSIKQIPVVDQEGRVVDVRAIKDLAMRQRRENVAVIMAGGLGKRLGELTRSTPKPLLPVGHRPLLGTIVQQLRRHGIWKVYIAVNYHASQIKEYLKDGSDFDIQIEYLEEKEFLGTAGPLSLLLHKPELPFLVMNGDILTTVNFANLLNFHQESGKMMTMCIREFRLDIPYGLVKTRGLDFVNIREKPSFHFFINSGIYVCDPGVLADLEKGQAIDMPSFIQKLAGKGGGVGCFPLSEYWLDIGKMDDYHRAQFEINSLFPDEGGQAPKNGAPPQ